jgi:hypothetical protein
MEGILFPHSFEDITHPGFSPHVFEVKEIALERLHFDTVTSIIDMNKYPSSKLDTNHVLSTPHF